MKKPEDSPQLALEGYLKGKSFTEVLLEVKLPSIQSPQSLMECVAGPQQEPTKRSDTCH